MGEKQEKISTFAMMKISPNPSFIKQLQAYEASLASGSKKQMDQSTSSSWYSKSPWKARC